MRDEADQLITTPGSLGVLDRTVDRVPAVGGRATAPGTLVLAAGRHPVTGYGVSAYPDSVVEAVLLASREGTSMAAVAAAGAGLELVVVDGGRAREDLVDQDALDPAAVEELVGLGRGASARAGRAGRNVALGEVGVGNTTVAAALTAACLGLPAADVVGLGAGADSAMLMQKRDVVARSLARVRPGPGTAPQQLLAVRLEPVAASFLVAGQRSRERGHALVLCELGLEPLLDVRLRAGEGVGAALAVGLLRAGPSLREQVTRTADPG